MTRHLVCAALLALASGCSTRDFHCDEDSQCVLGNVPGRCEANGFCSFPDIHCASGSRYGEHAPAQYANGCVQGASNEACSAAVALSEGTTQGDLRGARGENLLTCSPQVDANIFYAFDLTDCSDVELHAEAPGGNVAVGVTRDCAETLACGDASQTDAGETLDAYALPAGHYEVEVGAVNYDASFTLSMAVAPPPANDTCDTALDLTASSLPTQSFARAGDDDGQAGRDLFYRVSAPTRSVVEVGVNPTTALDALSVSLLDDSCNVIATKPVTGPITRFGDVAAGSYRLAVEGPAGASCGRFDLAATAKEVLDNNQCTNPKVLLPLDPSLRRELHEIVDLTRASDDYVSSVGGTGPDLVYQIQLTRRAQLHISGVSQTGLFHPVIYLRGPVGSGDCASLPEVTYYSASACTATPLKMHIPHTAAAIASGGDVDLDIDGVDAGTYQLVVDSEGGTGTLALDVTTDFPAGGAGASSAIVVDTTGSFGTGVCDIGSTIGAVATSGAGCHAAAPAVYRSFEIPAGCSFPVAKALLISAHPHDISIVSDCDTPVTGCNTAPASPSNGVYTTQAGLGGFDVSSMNGTCHVVIGAYAQSDAETDLVDFRISGGNGGCLAP